MAMTGAIVGGFCYSSQAEALDAFYSAVAPAQVPGLTTYVIEYVKSGAVWLQKSYSIDSGGVWTLRSSTQAPDKSFPACDPSEAFFDGMALGWGIVTAMVAVSALMMMRRGARSG